jgi:hypothetical protein
MVTHHVSTRQRLREAEAKIRQLAERTVPAQYSDPVQNPGQTLQQPQLRLEQLYPSPNANANPNPQAQQQVWQPVGPPPNQQPPHVQLLPQPPAGQVIDPQALLARWQADLRNGLTAQQNTQMQTTVLSQDTGTVPGAGAGVMTGAQGTMLSPARSRSGSAPRGRRSRSGSPTRGDRSRSGSAARASRGRSGSGVRVSRSGNASVARSSRSRSAGSDRDIDGWNGGGCDD